CNGRVRRELKTSGQVEKNTVRDITSQAFVVNEEEQPVPTNRTAQRGAKLVEMKRALGQTIKLVDWIVGVHGLVAIEPEPRTVKIVGSRFRYRIDYAPTSPAEFSGISIGVDLKFAHCILTDVIGLAAIEDEAVLGLSPERIIVVDAIQQQ